MNKDTMISFKVTDELDEKINKFVEESKFFDTKSQLIRVAIKKYISKGD